MNMRSAFIFKTFSILKGRFILLLVSLLLTIGNCFASNYSTKPPGHKFSVRHNADTVLKDKISLSNAYEIGYQAVLSVQTFESILNSITFNDNTATELQGYIYNSFTPGQRSRVFFANNVIIEDDINPKFDLGKTRDVAAEKYLYDLDLNYEKTADGSVKFSNFKASDIKRKKYLYINIKFDESFGSKYKADGTPYTVRQRIAEVRAERKGKKNWETYIVGIRYYDPNDPITDHKNAVPIVNSDTAAKPTVFNDDQVEKAMGDMVKDKMADSKKEQEQFTSYVTTGDSLFKDKQYLNALNFYIKAEVIRPLSPTLYKKINRTKIIIWRSNRMKKHHRRKKMVNKVLAVKP